MAQDWRVQLQSDDPKIRGQAVKTLALSGDPDNLPYLKEIVENDPDPRLREYAKKAARHLYTTSSSPEPEQSPPAGIRRQEPDPKPQEKPAEPEPRKEPPPSRKLTQSERTAAESKIQRALALHMKDQTQKGLKSFVQGIDLNPHLASETFTMSVASELTGLTPDRAIELLKDKEARKELLNPGKERPRRGAPAGSPDAPPGQAARPESTGPAPGLVQSWLSYFQMTEDFFYKVVGSANTEDTLISVLVYVIASMVAFLISSFGQLQQVVPVLQQELGTQLPDLGPLMLIILVGMIFLTPLFFYLGAGVQFLGLRIFGGSGTFKEHTYIMALITVPATVLSLALTLPGLVPGLNCVAGIAGLGLSIWSIVVLVRGMNVVHDLPTGRTVAGLIVPPIVLMVIGGCLLSLLGSALIGILQNIVTSQGGF